MAQFLLRFFFFFAGVSVTGFVSLVFCSQLIYIQYELSHLAVAGYCYLSGYPSQHTFHTKLTTTDYI